MKGCDHRTTRGREKENGLWCEACGTKIYEVHDRPCGECRHFRLDVGARVMGICGPKLMCVTSTMHVTFSLIPEPFKREGLCFEARDGTGRDPSPTGIVSGCPQIPPPNGSDQ